MRLVLLDCEGTLVDSQQAIVSAMTEAWRAAGLEDPDPQAVRRVASAPLTEAISLLLPATEDWYVKRLAGLYRDVFYRQRHHDDAPVEPLFPGVREALAAMRAEGLVLGIVTGKSLNSLVTMLGRHGLLEAFATLQTADLCLGKPNPDMVFRAQDATGSTAVGTVVVGDTSYDIEMACRAGVGGIGVAWGYHTVAQLQAAGAQRIVASWDEVPRTVIELLDADR